MRVAQSSCDTAHTRRGGRQIEAYTEVVELSLRRFFLCSESTACISFPMEASVSSGATKNWANLPQAMTIAHAGRTQHPPHHRSHDAHLVPRLTHAIDKGHALHERAGTIKGPLPIQRPLKGVGLHLEEEIGVILGGGGGEQAAALV